MLRRTKEALQTIFKHCKERAYFLLKRSNNVSEEESKYKFQKLTAYDEVDLNLYEDAINYIFNNSDIVNVAISGAYGAGKSSVIASYKKRHRDLHFVHVSLAHFNASDQVDEVEVRESVLEGKILNQLIHQIPSKKIPQTNFKVKRTVKTKSFVFSTIFFMVLLLSLMHIFLFEKWNKYVSLLSASWLKDILEPSTNRYASLVSGVLCIVLSSIFLYNLIKIQINRNIFKKINIQGNEIEIFEKSEESYFDKYLNEVLYLFENIEADVIVFEDMDRFNVNRIFERLREINTLANIQIKKKSKSPLRFLYLLRDDIFVSKDRTKFFDYIIPIIPVVDSSNSYDQFISHFKQGGIYDLFDENFLQGLSLYIDDMRILKNIYNEFIIYFNKLNSTELDRNKMLGIITYKNLFPRDFSDLQLNRGMVFTLFSNKDEFKKEEIQRLNDLAEQMEIEIKSMEIEHLTSVQELDVVYGDKRSRLPSGWNQNQQEQRRTLEKQYEEEYSLRKQAIENQVHNRLLELEEELSNIKQKINLIQNKQLKEIITRENIDIIFKIRTTNEIGIETTFDEIKGSDYFYLLKYLIRNGYIDETYPDYMTYFYENSLSRVDKVFLRSITDKKAKEYTYQLKNSKLVTSRIRDVDFDQVEILNFDLLEYLLQTPDKVNYLIRLLQQLKETKNFTFLGAYFDTGREIGTYIKCINHQWPEMFQLALVRKSLTEKQLRLYSIYTLYYSNVEDIHAVNSEGNLTNYISSSTDYLNIDEPNVSRLIDGFIELNVSFERIEKANAEILEQVYRNSLYIINFENLVLMLRKFYPIQNEEDIYERNYTLVQSLPDSPLAKYVQEQISDYIDVILSSNHGDISDNEQAVLLLLNDEVISLDQKVKYLDLLTTQIISFTDIQDNNLWSSLLEKKLVKYSEGNIFEYFEFKTLDLILISFINSNEEQIDFTVIKKEYGDEKARKFFDESIVCNELSNIKYKEILTSLDFTYETFNIEGISDEKFRIIVDNKIVPMELETLQFVRQHYLDHTLYFIKTNMLEYSIIMNKEAIVLDEILNILSWEIQEDTKIGLLKLTSDRVSIMNKGYSDNVNAYILSNNLDPNDFPRLVINYDDWNHETQQVIYSLAKEKVSIIVRDSLKVCRALLEKLLKSDDLVISQKVDLFISSLRNMDKEECQEYLDLLKLEEFKKIFESRTRPKYEVNEVSNKLLTAFKENGWIFDFIEDDEREGNYKIIRNKSTLKSLLSD